MDIREILGDRLTRAHAALNWPDWQTRFDGCGEVRKVDPNAATVAPEGVPEHRIRPTHTIGKVPSHNGKGKGGRPPGAIVSTGCQHDRYAGTPHDRYRFKCGGCGELANRSQWPHANIRAVRRRAA